MSRPVGSAAPDSFSAWLRAAQVGDTWWTDQPRQALAMTIKRSGRQVSTKLWLAVNDEQQAARLVRVRVDA